MKTTSIIAARCINPDCGKFLHSSNVEDITSCERCGADTIWSVIHQYFYREREIARLQKQLDNHKLLDSDIDYRDISHEEACVIVLTYKGADILQVTQIPYSGDTLTIKGYPGEYNALGVLAKFSRVITILNRESIVNALRKIRSNSLHLLTQIHQAEEAGTLQRIPWEEFGEIVQISEGIKGLVKSVVEAVRE